MGGGGSSRPGKGSRVPKNVKMRPAPAAEDRAKPRRKGTGKNAIDDDSTSDEEEAEEDRRAREQFAQDGNHDGDEAVGREDEPRPLEGMTICSSGTLNLPRDKIKAMCEGLGAVFEQVLTTETTFLLANTTESDKYKACVENGIPVIQSSFILELHHRWLELIKTDVLGLSNFLRLSPLQDLTICLTGYGDDRDEHRNVITQSGGAAYSGELTHEVTHLVVGPAFRNREDLMQNGKYLYAKQINNKRNKRQGESRKPIWIVWGEWLEHSLYAFGRVKEEPYSTDVVPDRNEVKPPPRERSQDIFARRDSTSPKKTRKQRTRNDHAQIKSKRQLIKQETNLSLNEQAMSMKKRSASESDGGSSELSMSKRAKTEQENSRLEEPLELEGLPGENRSGKDILEPAAVKKHSPPLSADPLGSTLHARPSSSLAARGPMKKQRSSTHMELLGVQDLLVPKLEESSQMQTMAPTSSAASMRAKADSMAIISGMNASTNTSLLSKMGKERSNKFFSKAKESTPGPSEPEASTSKAVQMPNKAETPNFTAQTHSASPMPEVHYDITMDGLAPDSEPLLPCSRIFNRKRFYIVPEDFDKQLRSRIANHMELRGGTYSDSIDESVHYIICKTISDTPTSFNLADTRLVSAEWIEACMAFDEIVNNIPLVEALKKPIRCILPLPGFIENRICISYSGFEADYERPKLMSWLDALGIPHEPFIRRKDMDGKLKTTHIIIPDQSYRSQRLGTAQDWGIQVVYPQWVREQALQHPLPLPTRINPSNSVLQSVKSGRYGGSYAAASSSDDFGDTELPLNNVRLHVPRKLQDWRDLEKLAIRLGARTIQNFDNDMAKTATHLVFQSNQTKPTSKDYVLAVQNKVKVVHPDWLRYTAEKGVKQPEASYKHTRDSKRGLAVAVDSPGMARISSSSSGRSIQDAPASDEYDLPPPLKKSSGIPPPSLSGLQHSMPRTVRSPQPPASPPRSQAGLSYSGPLAGTPERSRSSTEMIDENVADTSSPHHKADDSGFVASVGKDKAKSGITSSLATSSYSGPKLEATNDITSISKNIMAEMEALMQSNDLTPQQLSVRLPFQQQGGYQSRTSLRKSFGRVGDSASPNASLRGASAGTVEGSALARRQAFTHYDETQFGHHRSEETQTQAMLEEQTMVIKINDPVAEARKEKTLAELRRSRSGEGSAEGLIDAEATQRSTEETAKPSSRRSRTGTSAVRR